MIKRRSDLPKCVRHFKQLKGICVGGCVDSSDLIDKDHIAHAHVRCSDKYRGWICVRFKYLLRNKLSLLHEVAHLIVGEKERTPHGKKWKETVVKIGGTFKSFRYTINKVIYENIDYTYRSNKL